MKLKRVWKLMFLSTISISIIGCTKDPTNQELSSSNCQSLKHDRGTMEICSKPQKIVAIGPNMLELLLALDIQPVGYADYC